MEVLSNVPSVTYEYYQNNIKPKSEEVGKTEDANTRLEQGRMEGISSMVTALKNVEQDEETILLQIMTLYNLKEEEAKKYL